MPCSCRGGEPPPRSGRAPRRACRPPSRHASQRRYRRRRGSPEPVRSPIGTRVQAGRQVVVLETRPRGRGALLELPRAVRLEERLRERAADSHRLADRLHLRAERLIGARELLEREPRELDDDVVERRLEARRRRPRQVVRDLVERVPDRELCRDLGDGVAGGLGREGRGRETRGFISITRSSPVAAAARELDVRATGFDADGADDRRSCVAKLLVGLVGQRHLRRDRDRVARSTPSGRGSRSSTRSRRCRPGRA